MIIDIQGLRYSYPEKPDQLVLDIAQWSVEKQQHTFLHGPSGSGKSTLLNIISAVLSPCSGSVSVCGQALDRLKPRQRDQFRAQHIGYVFQQFNLVPFLNAVENIRLANHFVKDRAAKVQLPEIDDLLTALNISATERLQAVSSLSVGQQQRVAIARALINKPALLIADEPTSSLDQDNRDRFMQVLFELLAVSDTTLLFVSHDQSLASYFERVESLADINNLEGSA